MHVLAEALRFRSWLAAEIPQFVVSFAACTNISEFLRADQDVVAIGEVHDAQECGRGDAAGEAANGTRFQINDKGIAEAFVHESNRLIVGREVCALTEVGEDFFIGWKLIEGVGSLTVVGCGGEKENGEEDQALQW